MSTDTIANIKGRSLNKTGVTEKLARTYANSLGSEPLAIVRYTADSLITDADGQQKVILAIAAFEPVIDPSDDGSVEDMVRNLEAALYRNRGEADGQASIDDELDGFSRSLAIRVELLGQLINELRLVHKYLRKLI